MITEEQWKKAEEHLETVLANYRDVSQLQFTNVNTTPALMLFLIPLQSRFRAGERTQDLYDSMMEAE